MRIKLISEMLTRVIAKFKIDSNSLPQIHAETESFLTVLNIVISLSSVLS